MYLGVNCSARAFLFFGCDTPAISSSLAVLFLQNWHFSLGENPGYHIRHKRARIEACRCRQQVHLGLVAAKGADDAEAALLFTSLLQTKR
jgi:hypothetical protein